jgi:branched-chain amino acid transport system substrate-binding protein
MRARWMALFGCTLAAATVGISACGDDEGGGGGDTLTIYSSFPLQGASRPIGTAFVEGIELAVQQAGGEAAGMEVNYVSLDDSTAQAGSWTPEAESANARRAVQDETAVAYIGTFNSGAAAVSIPILNEAGMLMLSPGNTAVGLTSDEAGAEEGEPEKYYPTGERNYARIVPKDTVQGAALATTMEEDGCTTLGILHDKEVYGAGLASNVEGSASEGGLDVAVNTGIDPRAPNYRSVAAELNGAGVDCFLFSGITANGAVQLFKDVGAALPDAQLYGPDGVAEATFTDPEEGGIPADIADRTKVTVATLAPEEYPPEGQRFFEDYEEEYGTDDPNPYAIYGYEATRLVLDALERVEDPTDRAAVIEEIFATEDRKSVIGDYSIDESGDTTLTDYGVYVIEDGELTFDQAVQGGAEAESGGDAAGGGGSSEGSGGQ